MMQMPLFPAPEDNKTMAEFPALPLWTDAYLADTRHLSTLEHGAYLLLLMEAWRRPHCDLPDDDKLLARLAGLGADEWAAIAPVVMDLWTRDGRRKTWTQKRLKKERDYVGLKSQSQRDKAAKRWQKTEIDDATALPNACRTDAPTPTPTPTVEANASTGSKRGSRLPESFAPALTETVKALVSRWPAGMLEREIAKFTDHHTAKGSVMKDWQAALRTWLRNADEWSNRNGNGNRGNTATGNGLLDAALDEMRSHPGARRERGTIASKVSRRIAAKSSAHTSGGLIRFPPNRPQRQRDDWPGSSACRALPMFPAV